jgi:hypothetical protein
VSTAEVYARIDQLGDVCGTLADGTTAGLSRLYRALNLELRYEPKELAVYATTSPGVDSACVRGGLEHMFAASLRRMRVHATNHSAARRPDASRVVPRRASRSACTPHYTSAMTYLFVVPS